MNNNGNQIPNTQSNYAQPNYSEWLEREQAEKKAKTWRTAIVATVIVLIVALAVTLIVVLMGRGGNSGEPPMPPMMDTTIVLPSNGSGATVNGQPSDIAFYETDGMTYIDLKSFAAALNYDYSRDENSIKLLSNTDLLLLEIGSTGVTLQDQTTKATNAVQIITAPFEANGIVYVYVRDLSIFMKNTTVSYNTMNDSVEIRIGNGQMGGGPMGGGGQTMGGGQPMGGQPMGGQPMGGAEASEPQTDGNAPVQPGEAAAPEANSQPNEEPILPIDESDIPQ